MIRVLRSLFQFLSRIDRFLRETQLWNLNGFTVIYFSLILIGGISLKINERYNLQFTKELFVFLFGTFIYSIIPYMVFKSGRIRKYLIFGERQLIEEVVKQFSNRAYIVFVLFFTYFLIIPIFGIPLLLQLFQFTAIVEFLKENLTVLIYSLLTLTSILWFSYHIVYLTESIQKIKIKVALYTAIGTTFTIVKLKHFEQFSIVISCLLVSYLWIQYLIEIRTEEIEDERNLS